MDDPACSPSENFSRRTFLTRSAAGLSAAWIATNWHAIVSASEHAHAVALAPLPEKFSFFTPEEAVQVEAMASRIIPSDETPGAREAGAVYFIDRALVTFAVDSQGVYREGLPKLQEHTRELFPGVKKFSAATPEQQDAVLESLDEQSGPHAGGRPNRPRVHAQSLFEAIRFHTIAAFLIDPDSDRLGNRGGVGWKLIGRENSHSFQPPFGFYDKDYPGWQPVPAAGEKK